MPLQRNNAAGRHSETGKARRPASIIRSHLKNGLALALRRSRSAQSGTGLLRVNKWPVHPE